MISFFGFGKGKSQDYLEQEIEYTNEEGITNKLTVKEYERVVKARTNENFNNPERLYDLVLEIFNFRLYDEATTPLMRLNELDKRERSINLLALQKIKLNNYADALSIYNKFFETTEEENITYKAHEQYAEVLEHLDQENAKEHYLIALKKIPKTINNKELIEKYIQLNKEKYNKKYIESLKELLSTPNKYLRHMYIQELYKELKEDPKDINGNIKELIENIKISLSENEYKKDYLIEYANILQDLNYLEKYSEIILPKCLDIDDDKIYKQVLSYFLWTDNFKLGFKYIENILLKNEDIDLNQILYYENKFIEARNKLNPQHITMPMLQLYDKPILNKFFKSGVINPNFKDSNSKHIFITPISYIGNDNKFESRYINELTSISLYVQEQIYYGSKYNVRLSIYKNNMSPLAYNFHYTKEMVEKIAQANPRVDYIIYGEVITINDNNIYNLQMNIYNTTTRETNLLSDNVIMENGNYILAKEIIESLEKTLKKDFLMFEFDEKMKLVYQEILKFDFDFNGNNKYKLAHIISVLKILLKKYVTTEKPIHLYQIIGILNFLEKINLNLYIKYKAILKNEYGIEQ